MRRYFGVRWMLNPLCRYRQCHLHAELRIAYSLRRPSHRQKPHRDEETDPKTLPSSHIHESSHLRESIATLSESGAELFRLFCSKRGNDCAPICAAIFNQHKVRRYPPIPTTSLTSHSYRRKELERSHWDREFFPC